MAPNHRQIKKVNLSRKYKKPQKYKTSVGSEGSEEKLGNLTIPDVSLGNETTLSELPQIQEETIIDLKDN